MDAHPLPQPTRATLGGLCVGVIAMWVPEVPGNGYEPLNFLLDGQLIPIVLPLIVATVVATSLSRGLGGLSSPAAPQSPARTGLPAMHTGAIVTPRRTRPVA